MSKTYFPNIPTTIPFEGKNSKNPLAFKYYDRDQRVGSKTMAEHLRFSVAYWHTMLGNGADRFGGPSIERTWRQASDPMDRAKETLDAAFEFFQKLGIDYYCFHDRDIAPEGVTVTESIRNLQTIIGIAKQKQKATGVKLLWGTANLFSNPIYSQGAGTNPNALVMAHAATQVKNALEATKELGGENYVFWGGREGYETLLSTDLKREQEQMARFFQMAVDYKKKIGFKGQFLIEPKPAEPSKHQYDTDAATTLAFLREFDLIDDFKLNIEANHATLAGHTFEHELAVASAAGKLGSVDANRGDLLLGWDTDQFPTDVYSTTLAMVIILKQGGLGKGGLNFDAKVRRSSIDPSDLFYAHIGGMDAFARGLKIAAAIRKDGRLADFVKQRYSSWDSGIGAKIEAGKAKFKDLEAYMLAKGDATPNTSGRQEFLENLINEFI